MIDLGWNRKDEDGNRVHINFLLKRGKMKWTIRRHRHSGTEPYIPEREDWADLLAVIDRHQPRGKVTAEDANWVRSHVAALPPIQSDEAD